MSIARSGRAPRTVRPPIAARRCRVSAQTRCGDRLGERGGTDQLDVGVGVGRIRWCHHTTESESGGFSEAALGLTDLAEFAPEPDLAEHGEIGGQGLITDGTDDGEAHAEVESRLGELDATRRRRVDVVIADVHTGPAAQHRHEHREPCAVEAEGAAPWRHSGHTGTGERLYLDHDRTLALHGGHHGRARYARAPVGEEQRRGIGHGEQAGAGHLEQPEFVGGTEAVLRRAQQPQRMVTIALELQHRVDDVFEHAWSGETAVLGDVTDEHDRDVALLGFVDEPLGATAHLTDAAGQRPESRVGHRLDRVDHDQLRADALDRIEDMRQRGLGVEPQVVAGGAEALGAPLDLLGALFCGDVQRRPAPSGEQLQQQRALADARLAAEQGDRTGDEAAAEHAVELVDRGRHRVAVLAADVADAGRSGPRRRSHGRLARHRTPRRPRPGCSSRRTRHTARPTSDVRCRTRCTRGPTSLDSMPCVQHDVGLSQSCVTPGVRPPA
jgi:hypothetical protein